MSIETFKLMQEKFDNRIKSFRSGNVILTHYEEQPDSSRVEIKIEDDLKFVMFFSKIGEDDSIGLKLSMRISKSPYVLSEQYMHFNDIALKQPWEFLQGLYVLLDRVRTEALEKTVRSELTANYLQLYNFTNYVMYKIFPDLILNSCIETTIPLSKQFS